MMILTLLAIWSSRVLLVLQVFRFAPPLLARLTVGWVFIESGWGKLHHLDKVTAYFESLNLPAPAFQAPFVASWEFIGGLLLALGLFSRVVSVPLAIIMGVALATAKAEEITGFSALTGLTEFLYLVLLFYVLVQGPGALSLDSLLARFIKRRS